MLQKPTVSDAAADRFYPTCEKRHLDPTSIGLFMGHLRRNSHQTLRTSHAEVEGLHVPDALGKALAPPLLRMKKRADARGGRAFKVRRV
jgi:hypothetical protein